MKNSLFFLLWLGIAPNVWPQQAPETFLPPETPPAFPAKELRGKLEVDGKLAEADWAFAPLIDGFVQQNPNQGEAASHATQVRVLYDQKYLYIGAVCYDDLAKRANLRVQNLRRDYEWEVNDGFGIAIDGFLDKRNAVSFQTTPYGNIRDLEVIDASVYNRDWDALWFCRTHLTDTAWTVEMAIPWAILRYPEGTDRLGVIFMRNIRRNNEYTVLPAVPRLFDPYRMAYEAVLTDLRPPKPSANIQINPYLLYAASRQERGTTATDEHELKAGGEIKWAVTPNTVLDATINTDFAQADVDRQVVNLERFSVLFPERRQFFLESANLLRPNVTAFIQPFFSRRIGLDDAGNAIPLDAGLRLTSQTAKRGIGALAVRQRETGQTPVTHFGVLRYSQNLGEQSRLGGMVTYRNDAAFRQNTFASAEKNNFTYTLDGVFRPSQTFVVQSMASVSTDSEQGNGTASQLWTAYNNNWIYIGWLGYYVNNYQPGIGIERFGRDYFYNSPAIDLDLRPKWLPASVRRLLPGIYSGIFHTADLRGIISAELITTPLKLEFQNGAVFSYAHSAIWQVLEQPEQFVGITVNPGDYRYFRHQLDLRTDYSAKVAASLRYSAGGYFDGQLQTWTTTARLSPGPKVALEFDYEYNRITDLGETNQDQDTHLFGVNGRLALNPRLQLIGFYQRNTLQDRNIYNIRFSWEYRPLSFIYLVFNSNQVAGLDPSDRFRLQQGIAKIAFLKQF